MINHTVTRLDMDTLNASHVEMEVTTQEVILSVADGPNPGILFMDYDMNVVKRFNLARQENSTVMMSVYQPEDSTIL